MKNYIADGYNEPGYVAESPGLYSACRFTYRRALHLVRNRWYDAGRPGREAAAKAQYEILAKQLFSWDVVDDKGQPVPIKPLEIARVAPDLIDIIFNIVLGLSKSDDEPGAASTSAGVTGDEFDQLLESSRTPDEQAEADAKN